MQPHSMVGMLQALMPSHVSLGCRYFFRRERHKQLLEAFVLAALNHLQSQKCSVHLQ